MEKTPNPEQLKIEIIEPTLDRWEEIRDLRFEAVWSEPLAFGSTYQEESTKTEEEWKERIAKEIQGESSFAFYAESDGKIVASIKAYIEPAEKTSHVAYVVGLYVSDKYQGKGIGSSLFDAMISKLDSLGVLKKLQLLITDSLDGARELYEEKGFQEVGRLKDDLQVEGKFYDSLVMEKYL